MADLNRVSALIFKLLALSKDAGATEAEASLAAEKAQELMTEHNLSMANIEASGGKSGEEGQRTKDEMEHRQVYKWQRTLMASLAELNFCYCKELFDYHRHTNSFKGYQLIGRAANVASTRIMFDYLLQTINRLAKEEVKNPSEYFTRYAHSFKEGCADRIVERLQQRRATEVAEQEAKRKEEAVRAAHPAAAKSNALVVVLGDYVQDENDLNEDFRRGLEPGTTKARRIEWEREREQMAAARKVEYERRKAEWLAKDLNIDPVRLDYLASGYSPELVDKILAPAKPETEAQARKRREREERSNQRYWEQQRRAQKRLDMNGYYRGIDAGNTVGLDRQVNKDSRRHIK